MCETDVVVLNPFNTTTGRAWLDHPQRCTMPATFIALFTLAMLTTASAQHPPLPQTVKLHNKATKEPLGTATFLDNRIYLRDKNGEHYATIEINKDGTRTMYDLSLIHI